MLFLEPYSGGNPGIYGLHFKSTPVITWFILRVINIQTKKKNKYVKIENGIQYDSHGFRMKWFFPCDSVDQQTKLNFERGVTEDLQKT